MSYKALDDYGHALPYLDRAAQLDPQYVEADNDLRGTNMMENVYRGVAGLVVLVCLGVVVDFCRRHKALFKM